MSDKSDEFEAMSELQKQIAAMITQFPNIADADIADKITKEDGSHPSRGYVAKIRKRLGITPTEAQARELKIEVSKELPEAPEPQTGEGGSPQAPSEDEGLRFPELPPPESSTSTGSAGPTPSLQDDELLKPIFDRGFNRFINDILIERLIKIQEKIANSEEISDIETLALIDIKRLTGQQLTGDNLLIGTNIIVIGPFALKMLDAYRKRKAEEKPIPPPQPEAAQPPQPETPKVFKKGETEPRWAKTGSPLEEVTP